MDASNKKMIVNGILACMALVLLAVGVWFLYQGFQYKYFKDAKEGFAMKYPRAWQLVRQPQPGVIAIFISPKENALDTLQENVNISMTDLSSDPKTLDQYVTETQDEMAMVFKDMKLTESIPFQLASHPGHKFVFDSTEEPYVTLVVYAFLYRDVAYNITYLGDLERYKQKDELVVGEMLKSLKILF